MGNLTPKLGLVSVAFYGLGTILGAGIYVLVGKVAGLAGLLAPLSFILAGTIALITAFSYAQLVVLFPRSGGPAIYVREALRHHNLSIIVGWMITLTGVISAATLSRGFTGYLQEFVSVSPALAIICLVGVLGTFAILGISISMWVAGIMTVIEIAGLLLVIFYGMGSISSLSGQWPSVFIPASFPQATAVMAGAFLAFYAFIGFEDMVNIVEEVKNSGKNLPRAIFIAVSVSTALYVTISLISISAIPPQELANSSAPLARILEIYSPWGKDLISFISLFAITNGILIQIIMGSRVLYGMGSANQAPAFLSTVNDRTQTPVTATLLIIGLTLLFALLLPLVLLAQLTSFIILIVFILVNLSLWKIKNQSTYHSSIHLPNFPLVGAILCSALLLLQIFSILN